MDWIEPLLPIVNTQPGMSRAEVVAAAEASLLRQQVLEEVLKGERPEDDFNDLLRSENWDPDDYWLLAEANVDAIIQANLIPTALEYSPSGLVYPRHNYP